MLPNSLTLDMGLKVGPVMLGTLVKHYFDRVKARESADQDKLLRQDEVLYDEAFHIIKAFLHQSSFHTVEELQGFSNTRTPSSPLTHVVRELVPISCCDKAATYLVHALGGEDKAREVVGGVKWWQVRGIEGVDAQWITAKKDWRAAKRRRQAHESQRPSTMNNPGSPSPPQPSVTSPEPVGDADNGNYEDYMDDMRCILYIHGGGYYFGSVDQERYSIQRHARKINGRVFAMNYRLAPQYPFPCGLQDALASYLYLIDPPQGADHRPINPAHIVIAGDSAGGGMSLALLQVIRDTGLPMPAGGVLISPWCDLTHSFPSVHTNTDTDIIPPTGLSLHKPSMLWPPPPHEVSSKVHASLRQRLRQTFKLEPGKVPVDPPPEIFVEAHAVSAPEMPINVGESIPVPPPHSQAVTLITKSGEKLDMDQQFHFYTENSLLVHPLVSPAHSYLGGLPPLLFIASDKEVLRDEIIYTAHRAANTHKFHIKDQTRNLYPLLQDIEKRHPKSTSVHLQVYDGTCHILPVLFLFSTPAKYCHRAMSSFIKFVTGMPLRSSSQPSASESSFSIVKKSISTPELKRTTSPEPIEGSLLYPLPDSKQSTPQDSDKNTDTNSANTSSTTPMSSPPVSRHQSLRRKLSARVTNAYRKSVVAIKEGIEENGDTSRQGSDVAGARFGKKTTAPVIPQERYAGEPEIYENIQDRTTFDFIRERVSLQGVIRPLEPESELDAFTVPDELMGAISELILKRYLDGIAHFKLKFAQTYKSIEKTRKKNLERVARKDNKRLENLRRKHNGSRLSATGGNSRSGSRSGNGIGIGIGNGNGSGNSDIKTRIEEKEVFKSPGWGYAWALDENEKPPPSSIVARRDTEEARKLAEIADQAIMGDNTNAVSANNLWSIIMNFLTVNPDREKGKGYEMEMDMGEEMEMEMEMEKEKEKEGEKVKKESRKPDKEKGSRTLSTFFYKQQLA